MDREDNAFSDASQHIHKVAQGMHNRECEQENRRAHGAVSIVVDLDVSSEENGSSEHQDHIPQQENTSDRSSIEGYGGATSAAVVALTSNRSKQKPSHNKHKHHSLQRCSRSHASTCGKKIL